MITHKLNSFPLFLISESEFELLPQEFRIAKWNGTPVWWWLRSTKERPGKTTLSSVLDVSNIGKLNSLGSAANNKYDHVRPAIYVSSEFLATLPRSEHRGYPKFGIWENRTMKWIVVKEEKGEALLLSKRAICQRRFDIGTNLFFRSEIARWLNTQVFNTMFTPLEQKEILRKSPAEAFAERASS